MSRKETEACSPIPVDPDGFNQNAIIPYGCTIQHVQKAMEEFLTFLGFINQQMHGKQIPRLESFLMPATFTGLVGEFIGAAIPKYCEKLVRNRYHNGHPDLLPKGKYENDSILYAPEGIEIKGSRHLSGWQGHNAEKVWLMVFCFDANTSRDELKNIGPKRFRFVKVVGAQLEKSDWNFSGRSAASRRTITASVNRSGIAKMKANWIYRASE